MARQAIGHHDETKKCLDKAVAEYSNAIQLDPDNPGLYQKRGDAYQAMGDSDRAEADYEEAKRLKEQKDAR